MRANIAALLAVIAITLAACDPTAPAGGVTGPGPSSTAGEAACDQALCLEQTVDMLDALERPLDENVLKLFSAASDSQRNLVYVSGIMSGDIAVLDGATETWVRTIDTGGPDRGLKYLYADEARNRVYVLDATARAVRRIDAVTGRVDGPVDLEGFLEGHQALVDPSSGNLLVATRDHGIQVFGGEPLQLLYEQTAFGENTGQMAYDTARGVVYVLDSASGAGSRSIYVLDPATGTRTGEVTYSAQPNDRSRWLMLDEEGGRFLVGTGRSLLVLGLDGSTQRTIRLNGSPADMLYDDAHGAVAVLSTEQPSAGRVAGVGGHLHVYDVSSGALRATLSFGRKPHRMNLNRANGHIYVANGDAAVVWSIDTASYGSAEPIRLGDSVEQIALAANGATYLSSRLGGSYLSALDTDGAVTETFTAGTWPIPVQTNRDGTRLLVLNAWDSTLSVFDVSAERALLGTIALGIPDGSTDRLPAMTIDSSRSLAYVAYPEFAKVVVADFAAMKVIAAITIDGLKTGDTGGGPGQIQLAVDETRNRLFVLVPQAQEVTVYDGADGYAKVSELGRANIDWTKVPREGELLFFDHVRDVLFVGPVEVEAASLTPTGRSLNGNAWLFGADAGSGTYWGIRAGQSGWLVTVADAATLETLHEEPLPGAHVLIPVPALDAAQHRLYIGHQAEASLDVFAIGDPR